jgi:predicted dehydrogenase
MLGKIKTAAFTGQHPLNWGVRPGWYFEEGKHGGTFNDIAIHGVDAISWIAGCKWAKTLYARDRASWNVERIDLPDLGLDYARGTDRVFNTVILRQGNKVLRGYFYNTALRAIPWEDWLQATADALK